ncbi:hypothetical protein N0V90_011290 [Kalmusia sp. IMI 367209]|nr:hypothetical protein N0V90_011290 [Kalmusia sp. IMI 367209]
MVDDAGQDSDDFINQMDLFDDPLSQLWRNNPQTYTQSSPSSSTEFISKGQEVEERFHNPDLELINLNGVDVEATYMTPLVNQAERGLALMDAMCHGTKNSELMSNLFPGPYMGLKLHVYSGQEAATQVQPGNVPTLIQCVPMSLLKFPSADRSKLVPIPSE